MKTLSDEELLRAIMTGALPWRADLRPNVDWDHVYLLGYYTGRNSHLTTWYSDEKTEGIRVLVRNCRSPFGPPMWDAFPEEATLEEIPSDVDPFSVVPPASRYSSQTTFYAFGWYFREAGRFRRHTRLTREYCREVGFLGNKDEARRLALWGAMNDSDKEKIREVFKNEKEKPPEVLLNT